MAKAAERVAQDTGKTVERAFHDTGNELKRFFKSVCEKLNIPDGECFMCWTSDGEGEFFACKDGDPDQGTPPSSEQVENSSPSDKNLDEFQKWATATEPSYEELEPWSDGLSRFLTGNKILGESLPKEMEVISPTKTNIIRTKDGYGVGYFLSPRAISNKDGKRVGTRYHGGVDFVTTPGEPIYAPVSGTVLRVSNAYKKNSNGLKAIVMITDFGHTVKILYTSPNRTIKIGRKIKVGQIIGVAQDLSVKFKKKGKKAMINHVHLTIIDSAGNRVSPSQDWVIKPRMPAKP